MTTYLGNGVRCRMSGSSMSRPYVLAVGRSKVGIRHDGGAGDDRVHFILMLIAGEKARITCRCWRRSPDSEGAGVHRQPADAPDLDDLYLNER
jgi:diadenylate cyclase